MNNPNFTASTQATNLGTSTAETTIVTADANFCNNLVGLVITSLNAAASVITIKDSTGGNTRLLIDYPNAAAAPGAPCVVMFDPPLQQTAGKNNNWTATASVNATGTKVTALYVKGQ